MYINNTEILFQSNYANNVGVVIFVHTITAFDLRYEIATLEGGLPADQGKAHLKFQADYRYCSSCQKRWLCHLHVTCSVCLIMDQPVCSILLVRPGSQFLCCTRVNFLCVLWPEVQSHAFCSDNSHMHMQQVHVLRAL